MEREDAADETQTGKRAKVLRCRHGSCHKPAPYIVWDYDDGTSPIGCACLLHLGRLMEEGGDFTVQRIDPTDYSTWSVMEDEE